MILDIKSDLGTGFNTCNENFNDSQCVTFCTALSPTLFY